MMVPDINTLAPQTRLQDTATAKARSIDANGTSGAEADQALKQVASEFEAAFVAQMLTHSGLADAMTSGEGKMAAAFGSFYIEQLAEKITDNGGFGMAESIYTQLQRYDEGGAS